MKKIFGMWLALASLIGMAQWVVAANDVPTDFTNQGGIKNTRHNMSQTTPDSVSGTPMVGGTMNAYRNRYGGEVCVYCHTPHGADTTVAAPLWNRTLPTTTTYITYAQLNTSSLTQEVFQPGAASLPCLSCHDGSQAIDAIINMPGSGQYSTTPNPSTWNPAAAGASYAGQKSGQHRTFVQCMVCHNGDENGLGGGVATDFTAMYIGTDLRNDHPVGVNFPTTNGPGTDWNTPGGTKIVNGVTNRFFDDGTPNSRMDKTEIRLYGSGSDSRVECASCHDPHGVPSGGAGTQMIPTFLRKVNTGSAVCMTCHNK